MITARQGSLLSSVPVAETDRGSGFSAMCGPAGRPDRLGAWPDRSVPSARLRRARPRTMRRTRPYPPSGAALVVMIGTDSHKRTHTVVALDDVGRRLGRLTVAATTDGHLKLLAWAAQWDQVAFALEDCRHLTRRLERDLLGGGARIVRVPTRLMAGARRGGREPGKSDPIDAEAVALAALRHSDLPVAELDGPAREVRLLVDHRRDLVAERTRVNRRFVADRPDALWVSDI